MATPDSSASILVDYQPPPRTGPLSAIEKWLLVIFVIVAIGFSVPPVINHLRKIRHGEDGTKDYPLWYDTGHRELHGLSPYYQDRNGEFPFMYPPGAAGLLAPASVLGKVGLMLVLLGVNSLAWAVCILAPVYLLTGSIRGAPPVVYFLPSLICGVFIWDTYLEGQLAFCLSACLLGMFVLIFKNRPIAAGALLALAAGWKAFPIMALPYLIYRRQWKAVASTAVFLLLFLFVIPSLFRGPAGAASDLNVWAHGMMRPNTPEIIGQRAARSYTWQNGSVLAVMHRWLRPVIADHDDDVPPITINVANLSFKTINHLVTITQLALCLAYLVVLILNRRSRFTVTAEIAMLLVLIVLFCPLSFSYNCAWMMTGMAVILYFITTAQPVQRGQAIVALTMLGLIALLLVFTISTHGKQFDGINHAFPRLDPWWRILRARGNTLAANLIMLGTLAWLCRVRITPIAEQIPQT